MYCCMHHYSILYAYGLCNQLCCNPSVTSLITHYISACLLYQWAPIVYMCELVKEISISTWSSTGQRGTGCLTHSSPERDTIHTVVNLVVVNLVVSCSKYSSVLPGTAIQTGYKWNTCEIWKLILSDKPGLCGLTHDCG